MILVLSGKFLDTTGKHTECETGYWTLLAKLAFSLFGPKKVWAGSCLIIQPIDVFLLNDINRFGQTFPISDLSRRLETPWGKIISIRLSTNLGNNSMALSALR